MKHPVLPPVSDLTWAAVDLDGTLAQSIWSPEDPTSEIGPPIEENVAKLFTLVKAGWKIVIHTSRAWHDHDAIAAWMEFHSIPYHKIICGKLLAGMYIDNLAVNADAKAWTL